jgi:hypothetical protein
MNEYDIKKLVKPFMMFFLCVVLALLFLFLLVTYNYFGKPLIEHHALMNSISDWQTVVIEEVAVFKVPPEWLVAINDYKIFITDEEDKVLIAGTAWKTLDERKPALDLLGDDIEYLETVSGQSSSIGGRYSKCRIRIGDEVAEMLRAHYSESFSGVDIIAWCDSVDEEIMLTIAQSFRGYY